jgi:hypothetical protein
LIFFILQRTLQEARFMAASRICPQCGAVAPGQAGRYPSWGRFSGIGRVPAWLVALAIVCVVVTVSMAIIEVRWLRQQFTAASRIRITSDTMLRSRDGRGTDAGGTVINGNAFPVEVTVVVSGRDIADNVAIEQIIGPYRVLPDRARSLQVYLSATPLQSVRFDAQRIGAAEP